MFSPDRYSCEKGKYREALNPGSVKTQFQPDPYSKSNPNVFAKPDYQSTRPVIPLRSGFRLDGKKVGPNYPGSPTPGFGKPSGSWGERKTASEPATPGIVIKDRGLRPSDLSDPSKRDFLTNLTTKVFHLALEEDSHREKIPLERLFTPATDSGDITPRKKKAFASSDFYAPDHPTIDDQLQLAQRISGSLLDQCNKTSKGQAMYEKRKQKSVKWIHQEGQIVESQFSEEHFEAKTSEFSSEMQQPQQKAKPAMKLVMNPKGVQDINTIESHYQQLMEESNTSSSTVGGSSLPSIPPGAVQIPASPEIAKDLINDMQSPTGKGAALFAKRKKRMDKFIIDETNVQKTSAYQQEQQGFVPTEPGLPTLPKLENFTSPPQFNTSTTTKQSSSSYSSSSSVQSNKKKSVQERDKEQKQIMESFLKNRESTMKIVKSPWEAMLETGSISNAFEINQQQMSSLKTSSFTSGGAANKNVPSWLEMPKPVPMSAPVLKSGVFDPTPSQPTSFGAKIGEPVANAPSVGFSAPAPVVTPTAPAPFSAPAPAAVASPAPFSAPAPAAFAPPAPAAVASPAPTPAFSAPAAKAPASQYVPKAAAAPMTPAQRAEMEERRKSGVNFNLAASGWGTYNAYYRPTSFASS